MRPLLLASSSPYRRELLQRLGLPFEHRSPAIDESPHANEPPEALAKRLASEKARALAKQHADHLIIGSDQVAVLDTLILGKPHNFERAKAQLMEASGKRVDFLTALALLNASTGRLQVDCIKYSVHFRTLDEATITRYLQAEQPYDCAGSFKAERLGISLFRRMEGDDPTSLIGLPLIRLVDMLHVEGLTLP